MKVISYNLRKNRALGEIHALAERHRSDILCLQEADPLSLPATLGHLRLAGATEQNRLGLALYVSDERFETLETRTVALKKSLHDRVLRSRCGAPRSAPRQANPEGGGRTCPPL